jgi:hypothetical protein
MLTLNLYKNKINTINKYESFTLYHEAGPEALTVLFPIINMLSCLK